MTKTVGLILLGIGAAGYAFAGFVSPEIDANSGVAAVALISGALIVLRSRKRVK